MSEGGFVFRAGEVLPLVPKEPEPGVFVAPLLTPAATERLLAAVTERRAAWAAGTGSSPGFEAPNSMHEHGAMLSTLGLDGVVDQLLLGDLGAFIARRFGDIGGAELDGHHSYLVDYAQDADEDLGFHVDDSEVTLNLCLGETFSGAELVMMGRRCDRHRQTPVEPAELLEIVHEPGQVVLHAGRHRHRVDPILRGRRLNLIGWLRSPAFRARTGAEGIPCAPWCGGWSS